MKRLLTALILSCWATIAFAQTSPNLHQGQVLTPAQWNQLFINKQDVLGFTPLNIAGGTMTGTLTTASVPAGTSAGFNLTPGSAPVVPINGDLWTTSAGIFAQINGATIPLTGTTTASFAATAPLTVSFPSSVVTYALGKDSTLACTGGPPCLLGLALNHTNAWSVAQSIAGLTVTSSFTATGLVGLPSLASQSANTVVGAASIGSPVALAMPSCVGSANALQWVTGTGFQCSAIVAAAGSVAIGTTTITSGTTTRILFDNAGVLGEYTISGSGTAVAMNTAPVITGGSHVALTSLGIRSTGAAFDMTIANTEVLTAGRTLTVTLNDSARTINLGGNLTTGGAFTTSGAFNLILTQTAATNVTLPITGTLATLAGTEALTNKTYNGNTWTAGTGVLTFSGTKTLTVNNSIALTGTDSTVMTFPTTSATIARTDAGQTFSGTQNFNSQLTITSSNAASLAVGLNGSTNPAFNVDASTASSATGISIKSAAATAGVAISVISSGTNENLTLDAKGSGTITLNGTATGGITLGRAVTLNSTINKLTLTQPATGSTLTIADGKTHVVSNSITLAGTDSTTWTGASSNMTLAALNLTSQVITGGATVTDPSALTTSFTADCGRGPIQPITGPTSAWSITAPAADGSCLFLLTNASSSAVIPTFSGFSVGSNTGAAFTAVGSSKFSINVWRANGTSGYSVYAHQ